MSQEAEQRRRLAVANKYDATIKREKDALQKQFDREMMDCNQSWRRQQEIQRNVQREEWERNEAERRQRFRKGFMGLVDKLTGRAGQIARQNEREREAEKRGYLKERQNLAAGVSRCQRRYHPQI